MSARNYGWRPDLPDIRDAYHVHKLSIDKLPRVVDPRVGAPLPPIWNQGSLGACTSFAIAKAFSRERGQVGDSWFEPACSQHYYDERAIEGTTALDVGAYLRDGMKCGAQKGFAPRSLWPYDVERFAQKPNKQAYRAALDNRIASYARLPRSLYELKQALAEGYTVVLGFSVYESFESPECENTGAVPLPKYSELLLGGHAIAVFGYDDDTRQFIFANSYGYSWGDEGYGYLPYDYVSHPDLSDDFWVLKEVTHG